MDDGRAVKPDHSDGASLHLSDSPVRRSGGRPESHQPDTRPGCASLASAQLAGGHCTVTEPAAEDWGWYIDVECEGARYLVGASADLDSSTPEIEWMVQVDKHRTLKDKVLGQNKMAADDRLVALIGDIVRAVPEFSEVTSEPA